MKITFWGTRGSLPVALGAASMRARLIGTLVRASGRDLSTPEKAADFLDFELSFPEAATYGGNSPCVEIETGGHDYLLCDLGSGAREFSVAAIKRHGPGKPQTYHCLMSHVHWDHIIGFPFFLPAYIPGNRICIYGCHAELEDAFRRQHAAPSFPVDYKLLPSTIEYVRLKPGEASEICGFRVEPMLQAHGGDSYGYRLEKDGRTIVYSTDSEHKLDDAAEAEAVVAFFRDADLVVFDAMYSLADAASVKEDWGHSSNVVAVELCQMARVKHLCLFHHEPAFNDAQIHAMFLETVRLEEITRARAGQKVRVTAAYDGLIIDV
jgi:phosphoribosyl 1,2-cyclic phosphodiesterase